MRPSPRALLAAVALLPLASCDTLKARHEANQAAGLYKEGKLNEAAERYGAAAHLDPSLATVHLNLGFTHLTLFNQAPKGPAAEAHGRAAVEAFRAYIAARPDDERGRKYLIQAFVDTKRYDDAVAFFKPEVEGPKASLEAIALLAQIAAKVGRFADAQSWYDKRIALAPTDSDGYNGLGVLLWDHLHGNPGMPSADRLALADRAIAALKKSIELKPFPPEPYTYLNLVYRERSLAHSCVQGDGGAPPVGTLPVGAAPAQAALTDGGLAIPSGCDLVRADLAEAQHYFQIASEKMKKPAAGAAK